MWHTAIINLLSVYLSGELSGGGDDEGSETLVEGLAKVGQQGQTEGHSLTRACRSTCQDVPFLNQTDQWNQNTQIRIRKTNTFISDPTDTCHTCIMRGMACIWMGVGVWKPAVLMFWMTRGSRSYSFCSSSKVETGSGMSVPCTLIRFWLRTRFT